MLKKLKNWISSNDFLKGVLSVGSGNLLAQIVQVITVPLVSRIFTDAQHGQYNLIVSSASLITTFCTLGLTSAIMVPKDDEESNRILLTGFGATCLIAGIFSLGLLIAAPYWKIFEIDMNYAVAVLLMFLYIVFVSLASVLYTAINRAKLNRVLMVNPIIGACATLFLTIPLGLIGVGAPSFVIAAIIGQLVISLHMLRHLNPFKTHYSFKDSLYVLKKYKHFVIYQCPSNMISGFAEQAPVQILGRCFSAGILGNYTMCVNLMQYPSRLVAAPINTVYFRTANEYVQNGKDLSEFTYKMIKYLLIAAAAPIIVAIFWAKPIFVFVLGSQWAIAGEIASFLAFPVVLKFCSTCIGYCRVTLNKQKYDFIFYCINFALYFIALLGGYFLTRDFMATLKIYAVLFTLVGILDIGLNFYCLKNHFKRFVIFISSYSLIILLLMALK